MTKLDKNARVAIANQAIEIIASHGRKFFSLAAEGRPVEQNRISRFELQAQGRLWFIDKWTQKAIYTAYRRGKWRGFSEGGTLRALICEIADWITGKREAFPLNCFGPWPEYICGGDLWGYGKDMQIVREKLAELFSQGVKHEN
jgi:hypothetical protein